MDPTKAIVDYQEEQMTTVSVADPSTKRSYCISWNCRHREIFDTFKKYLGSGFMTDVVLSCATGDKSIRCHKLILAAASWYFEKLLENSQEHMGGGGSSFLVLKDVAFPDLKAILTFIYEGKVMLEEDRIPGFLKAAESLQVKGIIPQRETDVSDQSKLGGVTVTRIDQVGNKGMELENTTGTSDEKMGSVAQDTNNDHVTGNSEAKVVVIENVQSSKNKDRKDENKKPIPRLDHAGKKPKTENNVRMSYKKYTEEQLLNAIESVDNGMKCCNAAKKHGVPIRSLYEHLKRHKLVLKQRDTRICSADASIASSSSPATLSIPSSPCSQATTECLYDDEDFTTARTGGRLASRRHKI